MPFIFSRRYIQKCLNELRGKILDGDRKALVNKLNRRGKERLAAMWEAIILAHVSHQSNFEHEVPLENGKKPDFRFDLAESGVLVVGDITAVSDAAAKKANPVEDFLEEFDRVVSKLGAKRSDFFVRFDDEKSGSGRRKKVMLKLPKGHDRKSFFEEELPPYVKQRLANNDDGHVRVFDSGYYRVEIRYQPISRYASHSHASFTSALSTDSNPIWNKLKSKADQLRRAPDDAIRLLVLCDGGCDLMRPSKFGQNLGNNHIIADFFKRESGIDIVVSITERTIHKVLAQSKLEHDIGIFVSPRWVEEQKSRRQLVEEVQQVFEDLANTLPKSVSNIETASLNYRNFDYRKGGSGGIKMGMNKITFSVRELQMLLAGKKSFEDLDKNHSGHISHRFSGELSRGSTISNVTVVPCGDDADDDLVEFTFSPDPAVRPFE